MLHARFMTQHYIINDCFQKLIQSFCIADFDKLVESIECGEEKKMKLRKSVSLLRSFNGIPNEFLCPISMEVMTGKH